MYVPLGFTTYERTIGDSEVFGYRMSCLSPTSAGNEGFRRMCDEAARSNTKDQVSFDQALHEYILASLGMADESKQKKARTEA